jgi:RNA polymerase sigma factor (sigma-70 family)
LSAAPVATTYLGMAHPVMAPSEADAAVVAICRARDAWKAATTGNCAALRSEYERLRNAFVAKNLKLVWTIASRFRNKELSHADLMAEGAIGFMAGLERFDPDRGVRFTSYCGKAISQRMRRALEQKGETVVHPLWVQENRGACARESKRFFARTGREPTDGELAKLTGLSEKKVAEARCATGVAVSLNEPTGNLDGSEVTLLDLQASSWSSPESETLERERAAVVEAALGRLPERERVILGARHEDELTLEQAGEWLGITRERVRQIEAQGHERLRKRHLGRLEQVR